MSAHPERVFCVGAHWARLKFPGEWTPHADVGDDIFRALSVYGFYSPRTDELERDEAIKQVATYIVVRDATMPGRVLGYERAGSESRLRGRISVGIGGHLNDEDRADYGTARVYGGAVRELREEIGPFMFDSNPDVGPALAVIGWLNDDADPVGRVHLGIVFRAALSRMGFVSAGGKRFGWFRPADLRAMEPGRLERWSQILVDRGVIG